MSNIAKDRDAFVLAQKYGLYPEENLKYEMTFSVYEPSWTVLANHSRDCRILVKFNAVDLDQTE